MLDDGTHVGMTMQCADVKKTLASVHKMNQNGNVVILDGKSSVMIHKPAGKVTPIMYEHGQFYFNIWVKSDGQEKNQYKPREGKAKVTTNNRYAALAVEEEDAGFPRQGRSL